MSDASSPIKWFRDSSPYINAHRKKTFVLSLGQSTLSSNNVDNIVADLALLNSLGVRLVIVFETEQLQAEFSQGENGQGIVTPNDLERCRAVIGTMRSTLEAKLSVGLINSPMHGADITVTSGNFIKARPIGIINGVDHHHTGNVRRVNKAAIINQLSLGAMVIVPPLGYSPTGETFVLEGRQLAMETAIALGAEKLIYFIPDQGIRDASGNLISELQANQVQEFGDSPYYSLLQHTASACSRGVSRSHLISENDDGALLEELFTRDGNGTQIVLQSYEQVRAASPDDVAAIIALIEPLQLAGVLVERSRELIESEIDHFVVTDRDGLIVGCAALYPFGADGELACLATHPDYRNDDRGEQLLAAIEHRARGKQIKRLFALTTHTVEWFVEHGFKKGTPDDLPADKRSLYNTDRKSALLFKSV